MACPPAAVDASGQGHAPTHTLRALATLTPPSNSRTWQTAPHPSQPIVATACSDRTVRVYSLTSFTLLSTITGGHKRSVRSVSWKPHVKDQDVLATGSFDASAGIWRRPQNRLEREITSPGGGDDEEDEDEYQFACILDGHESEIKSLSWSPSGQYLATCSRDKSVWIWEELEEDNFETVAVLQEHDGDVKCVAWHPEEDLLVSASYDDTVRLYREDADDWVQVSCITGHKKTVWWAEFEGSGMAGKDFRKQRDGLSEAQSRHIEELEKSGPRLATCSDDFSVRIWRRKARERGYNANDGVPSIIRSSAVDEDWYEEAVLPQRHERAVYSVSWSHRTGMIATAGSDGKIIVYKERWKSQAQTEEPQPKGDAPVADGEAPLTEWIVVAELFSAHNVFEINHVVWAERADKGKRDDEEVVLSTGDDGEVRVWVLDEQGSEQADAAP